MRPSFGTAGSRFAVPTLLATDCAGSRLDIVLVGIGVRLFDQSEDCETFLNHGADETFIDQIHEEFTMQFVVELTVSELEMEQLEADHQFWFREIDDWVSRLND